MTTQPTVATVADRISATVRHRVAMAHVDVEQIFFARYFDWFDEALSELLVSIGHSQSLKRTLGQVTPLVQVQCEYIKPVNLDDVVETTAWISRCGRTSFDVSYESVSAGELRARGQHTHVYMTGEPRVPVPVPQWLRDAVWVGQ
jgi:acyl-CoA thioester hydrolase